MFFPTHARFKLETPPAKEPITLEEMKAHLRVDINNDDSLIAALIKAAREYAENFTGLALITQTWKMVMDSFPSCNEISLLHPPLQKVESIKYTTAEGIEKTVAASDYLLDTASLPGRIVLKDGKSWASDKLIDANGVAILYKAGFGDNGTFVPEGIKMAMKLMVGNFYEYRESFSEKKIEELPTTVDTLLYPYRVIV